MRQVISSYWTMIRSAPSPRAQVIRGILILLPIVTVLAIIKGTQIFLAIQHGKKQGPPPATVTTVVAQEATWERTLTMVGSLRATRGAMLSAEGSGKVTEVLFTPGSVVKAGAILVKLDSSVQEAQFQAASALAQQARLDSERATQLRARGAISQAEKDSVVARYQELQATATALQSTLSHMNIIAPYDGTTGVRIVSVGEYVTPGTKIVQLFNSEELFIDFAIPQTEVGAVSLGKEFTFTVDAYPKEVFRATITSFDPAISTDSRTLAVQGMVRNPDGKLKSGMFVTINLPTGNQVRVIPIPNSSIKYAPYGDTVYVIKREPAPSGSPQDERVTAVATIVDLGESRGDLVAVLKGLTVGSEVVTSNMHQIIPGVPVIVANTVPSATKEHPELPNT